MSRLVPPPTIFSGPLFFSITPMYPCSYLNRHAGRHTAGFVGRHGGRLRFSWLAHLHKRHFRLIQQQWPQTLSQQCSRCWNIRDTSAAGTEPACDREALGGKSDDSNLSPNLMSLFRQTTTILKCRDGLLLKRPMSVRGRFRAGVRSAEATQSRPLQPKVWHRAWQLSSQDK